MRVFVYEHITGGGCLGSALPEALLPEAMLMVRSLASDLAAVPGIQCVTILDHRVDPDSLPLERYVVHDPAQWQGRLDELLHAADAVWLIAPETDGILERLSRRVVEAGRVLLGSRPEAVRVAASKRTTAHVLRSAGVPVVSTFRADQAPDMAGAACVVKPDDGCGCEDTWVFGDVSAARAWIEEQREPQRYVLQPYVNGEPASLSVLVRNGEAWLLSVNRQRIVMQDNQQPSFAGVARDRVEGTPPGLKQVCCSFPRLRGKVGMGDRTPWVRPLTPALSPTPWWRGSSACLSFSGCLVNAIADDRGRLQRLAQDVAGAIPGLWGYIGIDLILAESGPMVMEVNPRITTSYAGLRTALGVNPAALVLRLLENERAFALPSLGTRAVAVDRHER